MKLLFPNLILITLLQFVLFEAVASGESSKLMSAKYCSNFLENITAGPTDGKTNIFNRIEFCSSSPYLEDHIQTGKANYVSQRIHSHQVSAEEINLGLRAVRGD